MFRKTAKTKSKIIKPEDVPRASIEQEMKRGPQNGSRPRLLICLNITVQSESHFNYGRRES